MVLLADQPSYLICQIDFLQVLLYPLAVARTRIYTALLLLIAVVIVVAPIDESFDRWDQPLTSGNWKGSSAARDKERLQPAVGHLAAASISADAAVTRNMELSFDRPAITNLVNSALTHRACQEESEKRLNNRCTLRS